MPAHDNDEPQYLTVLEAAMAVGFSAATLLRWMEQGRLPYVVISGERLLARKDVNCIIMRPTAEDPVNGSDDR